MAIANPRIHIICGICGSNKDLSFEIVRNGLIENEGEENECKKDEVIIHCDNCSSITGLEEELKEYKK